MVRHAWGLLATAGGSRAPQKQEVAIQEVAKLAGVNPPLLHAAQASRSFRTLHKAEAAIGLLAVQILAGATLQQVCSQINALDGRTNANSNVAGRKDAVDATVAASVVAAAAALALAQEAAAPPRADVAAAAVVAIACLAVATPVNSAAAATTIPVPIAAGVRATTPMDVNGTGSNSR